MKSLCRVVLVAFIALAYIMPYALLSASTSAYGGLDPSVSWCDISKFWDDPGESALTYVDLFCGAGGLSKGLEFAGLKGVCGLDFFKEAGETYARNFPHKYLDGDITLPETKSNLYSVVIKELGGRRLDLVVGGFPCQDPLRRL